MNIRSRSIKSLGYLGYDQDDVITVNISVKVRSVIGTVLFTPVLVTGPVSFLAFWTAILDNLALVAEHQFLTFVNPVAMMTHFFFSSQTFIPYLQALAHDDDDIQAVRQQIRKARGIWARIGQVLRGENVAPCIAAKFYKAVVQSVLLYESKTWNLTQTVLARLEGFHICAAYRMAWKHNTRKGLFGNWIYPSKKDVLEECGLHPVKDYIDTRRSTIAMYVVNRPILRECQEGERMRGSMPRPLFLQFSNVHTFSSSMCSHFGCGRILPLPVPHLEPSPSISIGIQGLFHKIIQSALQCKQSVH